MRSDFWDLPYEVQQAIRRGERAQRQLRRQPVSTPSADYARGIEDAAKVAEDFGVTWGTAYRSMTDTIAAAIRKLAPLPAEGGDNAAG